MMTFNIKVATWLIRAVFSDIVVPKILATLLCKQTRKRKQQEMWQSAIRIPTIKTLLLRKYLQIRACIKRSIQLRRDTNPILCYLQLSTACHKTSVWYERCPWQTGIPVVSGWPGKKTLAVHLKMSHGRTSFLKGGSFSGKPGANLSDIKKKKKMTTLLLDHTEGFI